MHYLKKFIMIAIIALMLVLPASATITVTPSNVGMSYITWTYPITVLNASLDGWFFSGFNPSAGAFTVSDLPANESHTLCVYSATDSGCNTTKTLPDTSIPTQLAGLLVQWWYLGLVTLFIIIGMGRKLGFFLIVASAISLYALAAYLLSVPTQTTDIWHLPFFLYLWFFIFPYVLIYFKGGWRK